MNKDAMADLRQDPRFRPTRETEAGIEAGGHQCVGLLLDISLGGFLLRLDEEPRRLSVGDPGYGEICFDGHCYQGRGRITHLHSRNQGVAVGFAFDRSEAAYRQEMEPVLQRLIANRTGGAIQLRDHPPAPENGQPPGVAAQIIGHLSPTLARDMVPPLNRGLLREVDLSQCLSIDSGGIGLMMIALDKGGRLRDCSPHIRPLMQTAYVCHRCASCN